MTRLAQRDRPSDELGPLMAALDERERSFVLLVVHGGYNGLEAAKGAGYSAKSEGSLKVQASVMIRRPRILLAMREEAEKHLDATAVLAIKKVRKLVESRNVKVSARAVDSVLDRRGFARRTEQLVAVQHSGPRRNYDQLMGVVLEKLAGLGLVALPAPTPEPVVDAEFTPVDNVPLVEQTVSHGEGLVSDQEGESDPVPEEQANAGPRV